VADGQGGNETRVTSFNDALAAEVALQPTTRLAWTVADGTEVDGWIIPPAAHTAGERYPMILNIHGGPHSAYRTSFSPMFQVQSGAGFYVLYINPRGSTSYGNQFKHAIHAGWGLIDEEDFITGVRAALAAYPDIDPARLGVTGGSYGGYMTNWLTARTDLFAAAVTRASISSWESLAKTTDSNLPHMPFDGASWEQREAYRAMSPLSYVENVRAPTLIVHGEHDFRTPLGEGEMWYQALKKLGVPTEFVLYPRSAHGIREPWLAADNMERTRQWFGHWLQPGAAEPVVTSP
jgi:dipeptidyl aminopeptidase/acylaminoacyl peptidase